MSFTKFTLFDTLVMGLAWGNTVSAAFSIAVFRNTSSSTTSAPTRITTSSSLPIWTNTLSYSLETTWPEAETTITTAIKPSVRTTIIEDVGLPSFVTANQTRKPCNPTWYGVTATRTFNMGATMVPWILPGNATSWETIMPSVVPSAIVVCDSKTPCTASRTQFECAASWTTLPVTALYLVSTAWTEPARFIDTDLAGVMSPISSDSPTSAPLPAPAPVPALQTNVPDPVSGMPATASDVPPEAKPETKIPAPGPNPTTPPGAETGVNGEGQKEGQKEGPNPTAVVPVPGPIVTLPQGFTQLQQTKGIQLPNKETLAPGKVTVVNNVPISLAPSNNIVVIGSTTVALPLQNILPSTNLIAVLPPNPTSNPVNQNQNQNQNPNSSPTVLLPNNQPLMPGSSTVINNIPYMIPSASPSVLVIGATSTIPISSLPTAVPATLPNGNTLVLVPGSVVTISGVPVSLQVEQSRTMLVVDGSKTITVSPAMATGISTATGTGTVKVGAEVLGSAVWSAISAVATANRDGMMMTTAQATAKNSTSTPSLPVLTPSIGTFVSSTTTESRTTASTTGSGSAGAQSAVIRMDLAAGMVMVGLVFGGFAM